MSKHYVRVPENLIVIDFDIKGKDGEKDYAELSKSGSGIHLHYIYDGDPDLKIPKKYIDKYVVF